MRNSALQFIIQLFITSSTTSYDRGTDRQDDYFTDHRGVSNLDVHAVSRFLPSGISMVTTQYDRGPREYRMVREPFAVA